MINWQKFKDEFCKDCMHYFYISGKKMFSEQIRCCQRAEGECKELLYIVILKAQGKENIPIGREEVRKSFNLILKGDSNA